MEKWQFVKKVSAEVGSVASNEVCNKVINAFAKVLVTEVRDNNESISIPGLGTFKQKSVAAHEGRNPSNGNKIQVSASRTITFKAQPSIKVKE